MFVNKNIKHIAHDFLSTIREAGNTYLGKKGAK